MTRLGAVLLVLAIAPPLRAEVSVKDVRWGFRRQAKIGRPGPFEAAEEWAQPPARKTPAIPRVAVTLANDGPTAEGLVLRYAVSAKVSSLKGGSKDGTWAVPFWLSEVRVPFLKAGQSAQIAIEDLRLLTSLNEMFRAGYWPIALKIEIMIKPRLGDLAIHGVTEKTLPVAWKAPSP